MFNSKNSLNSNSNNKTANTFKKSISSRPQVDGIKRREKTNNEFESLDLKNKIIEIKKEEIPITVTEVIPTPEVETSESSSVDDSKRLFFKIAGVAGLGLAASALLPKGADAYVTGSTPTSNVIGVKSIDNTRINPATAEGQGVSKLTALLSSISTLNAVVKSPAGSNKLRIYATRFSLNANADLVSFHFTSGGGAYETYKTPKTGGLYGSNNHPNYVEGGAGEALYCTITGTSDVQINIDYLEV